MTRAFVLSAAVLAGAAPLPATDGPAACPEPCRGEAGHYVDAQTRARHGRLFAPQDLSQLEGPDRDAWQKPEQIMDALQIADGAVVGDLGAGGGWFTIRLARRVGPNGLVYAEDIQQEMIEAMQRRVDGEGLRNVRTVLGEPDDPRLPAAAFDAVLIVDAYHEMESPVTLLRQVERALKPTGRLGIVDFKNEGGGPGPPPDQRIAADQIVEDARAAGLKLVRHETFLPYQYLLVFEKAGAIAPRPAADPRAANRSGRASTARPRATPRRPPGS